MSDVKETAERISTERLKEIEQRYRKAATIGELVDNTAIPPVFADEIAAMATELLASRHADAQEGGEAVGRLTPLYAAPSNPVVSDAYTDADELRDLKQSILQSFTLADFMAVKRTVEAIAALSVKPQSGSDKP